MINKDTQISLKNIGEYIVKVALVAAFIFLWKVNAKQDQIIDNQNSIKKIWQVTGQIRADINDMNHEIGMLKGRHIE